MRGRLGVLACAFLLVLGHPQTSTSPRIPPSPSAPTAEFDRWISIRELDDDPRFDGFLAGRYSLHRLRPFKRGPARVEVSGVVRYNGSAPTRPVCYVQYGRWIAYIEPEYPLGEIEKGTFPIIGVAEFRGRVPLIESEDIYCRSS